MKEKVPHPKLLSEKAVKLINKPIKAKTFFFFDSFKTLIEDLIIIRH